MTELLDTLGLLQAKGGMLIGFVWIVFELRRLRHDFNRHEHDDAGQPYIKVARSE